MLTAIFAVGCNSSQKTVKELPEKPKITVTELAETITEEELKEHLFIYASDEFEGRETGTEGQKKAIAYLKAAYEKLEIPAAKKNGDYFQKVPLEISKLPSGNITINNVDYVFGEHIVSFSRAKDVFDNFIYAGYGIEDENYSDYKNIDVTGHFVLIKAGEPKAADNNYIISGTTQKSIWSNVSESLSKRVKIAKDKGAKGIFYFDESNFTRFKSRFDYMKSADSGSMGIATTAKDVFKSFYIDALLAKALFPNIDDEVTAKEFSANVAIDIESRDNKIDSENVVAILRGTEKPEEYVVISSHLDHIGITPEGEINNGADDDGSGTVALLEIAEAFKTAADAGNGPKRSIVFLHVTGEEKGLLGSQYYTDFDPIFPLDQTVANLNIDMIGRIDPKREGDRNYIYLIGSDKLSTELHELSEAVNEKYMQIELDYTYNDENDPNRFYYRSDHYNFAKNNIPIIFYFNGTHADYHRPGDTPDKINYDLLQNRSRLVFHTAWEVANRADPVVVDKPLE